MANTGGVQTYDDKKYLDLDGLSKYNSKISETYAKKEDVVNYVSENSPVLINTTEYWNAQQSFVPSVGTIIVYSDAVATTVGNGTKYSPAFKIGDGYSVVGTIDFYNDTVVLKHKLTIGTVVFDGSSDVGVPVYDGTISNK